MRKIIYLLLVFTMLFVPISTNAETVTKSYDNLNAIGITLEEMGVASLDSEATRSHLAYLASKLSDGETYEKCQPVFVDVNEKNTLSGYIQNAYKLGILNGKTAEVFGPDEAVSMDAVNKVFSIVAGYEEFAMLMGGYPQGYKKAVSMMGLRTYAETNSNGNITVRGLLNAAEDFLKTEYNKFNYAITNGVSNIQTTNVKTSVLSELHKIDVYEGKIVDIDDSSYCASIVVSKNVNECNRINYNASQKISLKSVRTINLYALEGVKVRFWVNEDREIVNAVTSENTNVEFLVVDSINGDTSAESSYASKYIEKIVFTTDKKIYKTTDDFSVKYNFDFTTRPVKLASKYVKVVFEDDKVAFLETWDLQEGGIINVVGEDYIQYTQGGNTSKRLSALEDYTRKILYSDTKSGNFMDVKPGAYFDFYKTTDTIVMVASEKKLTDKLVAVSNDYVYLGNGEYLLNENYYVKNSYGAYQKNGDLSRLFGETVSAYFNASGECCYFEIYDNANLTDKEFTGIILGSKSDSWGENTQLQVFSFEGEGKTEVYNLKDKCILPADKTRADILAIKDDTNADHIFKFILDGNKQIVEITYPQYFYFYSDGAVRDAKALDISQIPYVEQKYFTPQYQGFSNSEGNKVFIGSAPAKVLIKNAKGDLELKSVSYTSIYGNTGKKIDMHAFGDDFSAEPSLVLICGQTDTLASRLSYKGFVTNSYKALDSVGEVTNMVEIVSTLGVKEYKVDDETLAKLGSDFANNPSYIQFKVNTYSNDNDIALEGVSKGVKLSEVLNDPEGNGFKVDTVLKTNAKRVYFENGKVGENYEASIFRIDSENRIQSITVSDISQGDTLIYTTGSHGLSLVLVK